MIKNKVFSNIVLLVIITFVIRILISTLPSFEYDESAYRIWSQRLVEEGPSRFYSQEIFTNNPLGGLYLFWIVGISKSMFLPNLSFVSKNYDFLLKLPANISDIIVGVLIYSLIKKVRNQKWASFGYLAYVLNPALILNSSVWGQYDAVATLFLILAAYMAFKKRIGLSVISSAVAYTLKPQAIFFVPTLAILLVLNFKLPKLCIALFIFLLTLILLYLPFFPSNPIYGIVYANRESATLFNCTTCFAFNFWGIFGNWQNDLQKFVGIPLFAWGLILLFITFIPIFFLKPFDLKFKPPYFYLTAAISIMAFFIFLTRMHERYLFPFFPFILLAALMLRSRILIGFYILVSCLHLLNLYISYAYYNNLAEVTSLPINNLIDNFKIFSFISFLVFVLLYFYYFIYVKENSVS